MLNRIEALMKVEDSKYLKFGEKIKELLATSKNRIRL